MNEPSPEGTSRHRFKPTTQFDGGDLDCGGGLLLQIRRHIDPLAQGELLEILSTEPSVAEDLPAWCRLTGNELVSTWRSREGRRWSFLISKQAFGTTSARAVLVSGTPADTSGGGAFPRITDVSVSEDSGEVSGIAPLSVMGIGSWPRPEWLLSALRERLEGRLDEDAFQQVADRAVERVLQAQLDAGVDVLTDGEQRRDSYASFVGARLENCQLIPIVDLLPYVEHPDEFARELRALDVPAESVRHPAVFGRLRRNPARPLAIHELRALRARSDLPVKIALPGPYLLSRTMWLECVSDRVYETRETLAEDIVSVLREEIQDLLAAGAALVQLDEPVLTEVVHGRPAGGNRSFMCGALSERRDAIEELEFARSLLTRVLHGLPRDRLALHVCRGNWTRDTSVALSGDYQPLLPLFSSIPVGTLFLELCTPRAGDLAVLRHLPEDVRIGVGMVDQKTDRIESVEEIVERAERAIALFGPKRVLLNPDCGFATFADNPIASYEVARSKLARLAEASRMLRDRYA
jgi:5-methyltetrahydropteroyltriglutamate--homocysteine methyltransferase